MPVATPSAAVVAATPAVPNASLRELVEHVVTDMLLVRRPTASITRTTELQAVIWGGAERLAFLFEVREALGWSARMDAAEMIRPTVTIGRIVEAFVTAAPEAA